MKMIIYTILIVMMAASFAIAKQKKKIVPFDPCPRQFYIYIESYIIEGEDDTFIYDGVKFPLYIGYVIIKDDSFVFVKKTHFPIKRLVEYFDDIQNTGSVNPVQSIKEQPKPRVPITNMMFDIVLHESMTFYNPGIFVVEFTGKPDENYKPVFTETCIFKASDKGGLTPPEKSCSFGDFSIPACYLLVPTSNVLKERLVHYGIGRGAEVERYNSTTKQWEYIGNYW